MNIFDSNKITWIDIGKSINRRNITMSKKDLLDIIDGVISMYESTIFERNIEKADYRKCIAELEKYKKINASLIAKEIPEEIKNKVMEKFVEILYEV